LIGVKAECAEFGSEAGGARGFLLRTNITFGGRQQKRFRARIE
jgi:hypothetical protein